ncbi:MAG: AMP-binding protein [Deltaproteobacteria bacterium]|nr:AMP-binding protein [Deltaproteobacteria bacterium]
MTSSFEGELLWHRWVAHARREPDRDAVVHLSLESEPVRLGRGTLLRRAAAVARRLREAGVRRGDVCALMLRHTAELYPLYLGIAALGAVPSILAYPNARLHPDKFLHGLAGMARRSGLEFLLTEEALATTVRPLLGTEGCTIRDVLFPLGWPQEEEDFLDVSPEAHPDEPCLLQHSSGTTGLQKAVKLSHCAVLRQIEDYAVAIELRADDRIVSWLPLYHDMGLIAAFHLPLATGTPTVQLSPFEWVQAPHLLLEALHTERGTVSWLPNFAYHLLASRVRREDLGNLRLDHVRLLVNCSEPVRAASHAAVIEALGGFGLSEAVLSASYAMAETTFAVTQTRPGMRARELGVSRARLKENLVVPAGAPDDLRVCVSSGHPIPGARIEVRDANGGVLPDGAVGQLWAQSASMFDGYANAPEDTALALVEGWYRTGDVGFVVDGEVYVSGREKDLIIHAGKNLYPEDIEDAVGAVDGVLPGRVVAFGLEDEVTGTEVVCVIAETELGDREELSRLRIAVLRAGMAIDVTIARVYFAPPRWLVKSSSGKLSRKMNRQRLQDGALDEGKTR